MILIPNKGVESHTRIPQVDVVRGFRWFAALAGRWQRPAFVGAGSVAASHARLVIDQ